MNAISRPPQTAPMIPENAPFSPEQRAWLNGFFAGLLATGFASRHRPPRTGKRGACRRFCAAIRDARASKTMVRPGTIKHCFSPTG